MFLPGEKGSQVMVSVQDARELNQQSHSSRPPSEAVNFQSVGSTSVGSTLLREKKVSVDQLRRNILLAFSSETKPVEPSSARKGSLGGRPPRLDQKLKEFVCLLVSVGMSRRKAAVVVGCNPSTISHAAKRSELFSQQLKRAEALAELDYFSKMVQASSRSWQAAAWLLDNFQAQKKIQSQWNQPRLSRRQLHAALSELAEHACRQDPENQRRRESIFLRVDEIAERVGQGKKRDKQQ